MHVTSQLEGCDQIGCVLFLRGTRKVELSGDGAQLLPTAVAVLSKLDQTVRQIRRTRGRREARSLCV